MSNRNRERLADLVRLKGFKFTDTFVPYTSGKIGSYYVQSLAVTRDGKAYRDAVNSLNELILCDTSMQFDVISGGESKDWDFSNPVAVMLSKPHAKLYKNGLILGRDVYQRRVVHVADINNEGYSLCEQWIPQIKKAEGIIKDCFFYIDRMEGGKERIQKLGVTSHAIIELDEAAWMDIKENPHSGLTEEIYRNIMERRGDKDAWAVKMLKSDRGFAELKRLYENPAKNQKAIKVLNMGYPELKDELTERLAA